MERGEEEVGWKEQERKRERMRNNSQPARDAISSPSFTNTTKHSL